MSTKVGPAEKVVELPPILRLPTEIRQMILLPLLVTDDTLHCPSRVYGNQIISWKASHGVQPEMMFICQALYHEVLFIFIQQNQYFFSVPPTTTLFPCALHAPRAKSLSFKMLHRHWALWEKYLSANKPLISKALHLRIRPPSSIDVGGRPRSLVSLINLCESLIDNIVVTESVSVVLSYGWKPKVRSKCSYFYLQ